MTNKNKWKKQQTRHTEEDQKKAWHEVIRICTNKIRENTPLSPDEREIFRDIMCDAVLSRTSHIVDFIAPDGRVIRVGHISDIIDILMYQHSKYFHLYDHRSNTEYTLPYSFLWKRLRKTVSEMSGYAHEEALHMSAEKQIRESRSSYKVSLND